MSSLPPDLTSTPQRSSTPTARSTTGSYRSSTPVKCESTPSYRSSTPVRCPTPTHYSTRSIDTRSISSTHGGVLYYVMAIDGKPR